MSRIPETLSALLTRLIDYAGLYPPAALPLAETVSNYESYVAGPESWILNRLVLPAKALAEVRPGASWRVTLLVDDEPGPLAPQVETLETKGAHRLSLPTYCEAPPEGISGGGFAKLRTGGLTPCAIPSVESVADFLYRAAARRLPFKATAGLHHPLRSDRALTYAADSPRATMHGFINVFVAAAFAWRGAERAALLEVLNATGGFEFGDHELRCCGRVLTVRQIQDARREFAHSFGSCSFEEPIADLRELGLLP